MQLPSNRQWLGWPGAAGRSDVRNAPVSDELLIRALQPLRILQIGVQGQLLCGRSGVAVLEARSLDEALDRIDGENFDAVALGPAVADVWPTAAYERVAEVAGPIPIMVYADPGGPMAVVKRRHDRREDVIVPTAAGSTLLERLMLAAIVRSRALAVALGTQLG